MSIFGKIMGAIFGHAEAAPAGGAAPAAQDKALSQASSPSANAPSAAPTGSASNVDVAPILDKRVMAKLASNGGKLPDDIKT